MLPLLIVQIVSLLLLKPDGVGKFVGMEILPVRIYHIGVSEILDFSPWKHFFQLKLGMHFNTTIL
jgi:hypothetical protein